MKRSININLYGTLYAIDEDAHQLLDQYLSDMKVYFSRQPGGEEIADDIEHRIAELFWELRQQGTESITIEQVTVIIHQVGNPEEVEDSQNATGDQGDPSSSATSTSDNAQSSDTNFSSSEDHQSGSGSNSSSQYQSGSSYSHQNDAYQNGTTSRRFYRDPQDKVIGGVIGGICRYFNINDAIIFRIVYILLCLFTDGIFILIYLILWLIVPLARTAEDRLRMQGRPVNPDNIRAEVLNNQSTPPADNHGGCLKALLVVLCAPMGCLILFVGSILLFVLATLLFSFFGVGVGVFDSLLTPLRLGGFSTTSVIGLLLSAIAVIGLPIYALYRWFRREQRPDNSLTWVILAGLLMIAGIIGWNSYRNVKTTIADTDWSSISIDDIFPGEDTNISYAKSSRQDTLAPFQCIQFAGVGKVEYQPADSFSIRFEGSDWLIKHTMVNVKDSVLHVETDDQAGEEFSSQQLQIIISAPSLSRIEMQGVGSFSIPDAYEQTVPLSLVMEGVGKVSTQALTCPVLTLHNEGVGKIDVGPVDTDSLYVTNSGIGKIHISGKAHAYVRNDDGIGKVLDNDLHIGQ